MSESTKLRVMYIAPRLHPNQNPILEGWIRGGDEVCFLSRTEGAIEDHPVLEPILLGTSRFHKIKNIIFERTKCIASDTEICSLGERFSSKCGDYQRQIIIHICLLLDCKNNGIGCGSV